MAAAYDVVASDYAALLEGFLDASVFDRAVLDMFAGLVRGGGPVADLGCGPGRLTGWLTAHGLEVVGVDLSPGMVAEARRRHPAVRFEEGSLLDPPLADLAPLAGALHWYSLIHVPPADRPTAFATAARLLRPGAPLVVAFQVGDDVDVHLDHAYGHDVDLRPFRLDPDRVLADARAAGFDLVARVDRAPEPFERQPQCYLLLRRPS